MPGPLAAGRPAHSAEACTAATTSAPQVAGGSWLTTSTACRTWVQRWRAADQTNGFVQTNAVFFFFSFSMQGAIRQRPVAAACRERPRRHSAVCGKQGTARREVVSGGGGVEGRIRACSRGRQDRPLEQAGLTQAGAAGLQCRWLPPCRAEPWPSPACPHLAPVSYARRLFAYGGHDGVPAGPVDVPHINLQERLAGDCRRGTGGGV